jgi:Mg-chelatase subunit ChlD
MLDRAAPGESREADFELSAQDVRQRGPRLEALAMFRGHEYAAPSLLRMLGGLRIDYRPHVYRGAQVTLYGARRKEASLMFVLDCSQSMNTPIPVEAPGAHEPNVTSRMNVAKNALQSLLERLAQQPDRRVGVRFYGHRAGWNLEQPTELLVQPDYGRPIPSDLMPYEDVELVLPLGRFDMLAAGRVMQLLPTVQAWGETPLYLSLVEAVRDLAADNPGTEKSVVVITDGVNYQFNPTPEVAKRVEDVLSARGDQPIRVHLVGFGIPEQERELAAREFRRLADETDGSYHLATSVNSLMETLEALLGFGTYRVEDDTSQLIGEAEVDLPIAVDDPLRREPYRVRWQSLVEPIPLEGGEAAELRIDPSGRKILSVVYDRGQPLFAPLIQLGTARDSGVRLGVHRPLWDGRRMQLAFSFQRSDSRFAARPAEAWLEVTPHRETDGQTFPKYIFYDVNYEPGKPVPVLEWLAADWPSQASHLAVTAWCKMSRTAPSKVVPLAEVADRVPERAGGHRLECVPGLHYQVRTRGGLQADDPWRVSILERHGPESPGTDAVKVDLWPRADRVVHQFDAENRLVMHSFFFDLPEDASLPACEIHFTTREALRMDAWETLEPLVLSASSDQGLLEVSTPQLSE